MSEEEQVEALKKWWKENSSSVIAGVAIGLSLLFGSQAWFGYQDKQKANASNVYTQMMRSLESNEIAPAKVFAQELISNHSDGAYGSLAAMALAKLAVEDADAGTAIAHLRWAVEHAGLTELKYVAKIRLVRVMIDAGMNSEAQQILAEADAPDAYQYLFAELEGDLAVASGSPDSAAESYKMALDKMPEGAPNAALLTIKHENVASQE